jgi:AAA ATPase-like protein/adenylate/guanylate cyclase family protein
MGQSLEQLNPLFEENYGVRLDLRVGVATGEAVAAAGTADQFMVTGEVANLAARLQSAAEGVVVSEETYRALDPLLEAEPLRELTLKGFSGPVSAYRVTGIRTAGGRPRGLPGRSSPVVGREAEMRTLRACIDDLRHGRGQVVTIVGEPGIGKSRLKIEIRETLPDGVRWLEGGQARAGCGAARARAGAGGRWRSRASRGGARPESADVRGDPVVAGTWKLDDDAAEGRRLIARARAIFDRIGAIGWVTEADVASAVR